MASRDLISRGGKGAALNIADHDQNLNCLASTSEEQTGATYEVVYTDQGKLIELNNASMVCTLDAIADIVAAMDSGVDNFSVTLKNTNAADATVNRSSTDTIDGETSLVLGQNKSVTLQTNAADDSWLIKQDVKPVYAGRVSGSNPVSSSTLPVGWSAATSGTGVYTVTHSLGLASSQYAVCLTIHDSTGTFQYVSRNASVGPNTFTYTLERVDGTNANLNCSFIMMIP